MLIAGTTHRGKIGRIASYMAWPFRELILAYRDRRSPEMIEIRQRAKVAEIIQFGSRGYVNRQTLRLAGAIVGMNVIWELGERIGGKGTFDIFGSNPTFETFLSLGLFFVVLGRFAAKREISNLRKQYPEELSAEEA